MACKDKCVTYKASKPFGEGRYASGQSRCSMCVIYINYAGIFCPCCGSRLRKKPRSLKYKTKLQQAKERLVIRAD